MLFWSNFRIMRKGNESMETNDMSKYKTDPIFERYVQPYDKNARQQLLSSVIEDIGGRVMHVWNNLHLNDKTKMEICLKHGINLKVRAYNFSGRNSAAYYICSKELKREDLHEEYRKYLVGQEFHYKELIDSKDPFRRISSKRSIATKIGEELGLAPGTVLKYNCYSDAVDVIFDAHFEFAQSILLGNVKISQENVIELSRMRTDEIRIIAKAVANERLDKLTLPDMRNEIKWMHMQVQKGAQQSEETPVITNPNRAGSIRQMPVYDPDSEVNSLCMTMGSWKSSINRVNNGVDFNKITTKARIRLTRELTALDMTIKDVLEALGERTG